MQARLIHLSMIQNPSPNSLMFYQALNPRALAGVFDHVNPMTNDEHNLMTRIREGDKEAFNILVDRYQEIE